MIWLRNKKTCFQLHTRIWRPDHRSLATLWQEEEFTDTTTNYFNVILKWSHHIMLHHRVIRNIWEHFKIKKKIEWQARKRIHYLCAWWDRNLSLGSPFSRCQKLIRELNFFIPTLTLIIDSYILVFFEDILSTQSSFEHRGQSSVYS